MQATYNGSQDTLYKNTQIISVGNPINDKCNVRNISNITEIHNFKRFLIIVTDNEALACVVFDKKTGRYYPIYEWHGYPKGFKAIEYNHELYLYRDNSTCGPYKNNGRMPYFFGDKYYENYRNDDYDYTMKPIDILKHQLSKKDIDLTLIDYGSIIVIQ